MLTPHYQHLLRMVEINHQHHHKHLPAAMSAFGVIEGIFISMKSHDLFILSKGHAADALYPFLEKLGYHPDVSHIHPERDPQNGILCTTGSLGHGLPMAVGIALAHKLRDAPGVVHVLIGDGEALEGSNWEALNLAIAWGLQSRLKLHVDWNGTSALGACPTNAHFRLSDLWPNTVLHFTKKNQGLNSFRGERDHIYQLSDAERDAIQKEIYAKSDL